jgi:hypothetical protein
VGPGSAGGDDYPIKVILMDVLLEGGQALLGAAIKIALGVCHIG